MSRPDTHTFEPLVKKNNFIGKKKEKKDIPLFSKVKKDLPQPFWDNHQSHIDCYWKSWELGFNNLKNPSPQSLFITNFIDTAFNDNLFLWDSIFILMFGKYGKKCFNFQKTMDNFYAHQHKDGYICREIRESDSFEMFERFDPSSTGPNLFAWSEWEYYLINQDKKRLCEVFPPILAYNRWFQKNRSWPDGTYWASGWGCGMDNQPRLDPQFDEQFDHGHLSWIDICLQQILSDKILIKMAKELDKEDLISNEEKEIESLTSFINENMWSEQSSFYFDLKKDKTLSHVKSIAAYWALLAEIVPPKKLKPFLDHLTNSDEFNTPHPIPTLSKDHPQYSFDGGYWKGGVWSPTNYMVLKGLALNRQFSLSHSIALKHVNMIVENFKKSDTLWENYSPEGFSQGSPSRPNFVGWSGLSSISILFEFIFGIQTDQEGHLIWYVKLCEKHGIYNFPLNNNTINIICSKRDSIEEKPDIIFESTHPLNLRVISSQHDFSINSTPIS